MKRFYLIALAIAITCALTSSVAAQKMTLKSITAATIDGIEFDVFEVEPFGFKLPFKSIGYVQKDVDLPEAITKSLESKDSPIIKDAMLACIEYNCTVFEYMFIAGKTTKMENTTTHFVATTGTKERTTRLTISLPKVE